MSRIGRIALAVWEFVVGDDWRVAVGVALAIAATGLLAGTGLAAWWVLPILVAGLLIDSLRRAAGASGSADRPDSDHDANQIPAAEFVRNSLVISMTRWNSSR